MFSLELSDVILYYRLCRLVSLFNLSLCLIMMTLSRMMMDMLLCNLDLIFIMSMMGIGRMMFTIMILGFMNLFYMILFLCLLTFHMRMMAIWIDYCQKLILLIYSLFYTYFLTLGA